MLDAESPTKAAGVHDRRVFMTRGIVAGRSLTRFTQELSRADKRSGSLTFGKKQVLGAIRYFERTG